MLKLALLLMVVLLVAFLYFRNKEKIDSVVSKAETDLNNVKNTVNKVKDDVSNTKL